MNIIWNITRLCPYKCRICSVCSIPITDKNKNRVKNQVQGAGLELTFNQKTAALQDILTTFEKPAIDFSGGDPLVLNENVELIKLALIAGVKSEITATGHNLTEEILQGFKRRLDMFEFTLDMVPEQVESTREQQYHLKNTQGLRLCAKNGIPTRVCTVLKKDNSNQQDLKKMYELLTELQVTEWELLRFYPIGRGTYLQELVPTKQEYKDAIEYCLGLETKNGPKIGIQHSFHSILKELNCASNKCQAVINQVGILPDGTVLACPWALNEKGQPIDDIFVLGKTPEQKFTDILNSEKAKQWVQIALKTPPCRTMAFLEHRQKTREPIKALALIDSYARPH